VFAPVLILSLGLTQLFERSSTTLTFDFSALLDVRLLSGMKHLHLVAVILSASTALAYHKLISDSHRKYDLTARGRPVEESPKSPNLKPGIIRPDFEHGGLGDDWWSLHKLRRVQSAPVYRQQKFEITKGNTPKGETSIHQNAQKDIFYNAGSEDAALAKAISHNNEVNPGMTSAQFKSPEPPSAANPSRRERALILLRRLVEILPHRFDPKASNRRLMSPVPDGNAIASTGYKISRLEALKRKGLFSFLKKFNNDNKPVTFRDNTGTPGSTARPFFSHTKVKTDSEFFNWENYKKASENRQTESPVPVMPPPPRVRRRNDPVAGIPEQEANSGTDKNAAVDAKAQFQTYLQAFEIVQSNISTLLFPWLDAMLEGSNSTLVHDAAWSIHSDLTISNTLILGPVAHGMHCLDSLEDQLFASNSTYNSSLSVLERNLTGDATAEEEPTDDELAVLEYLALHGTLLDLYDHVWTNAVRAVNATGLLADLTTLAGYLLPEDMSIAPAGFGDLPKVNSGEEQYFTAYNRSTVSKGNITVGRGA